MWKYLGSVQPRTFPRGPACYRLLSRDQLALKLFQGKICSFNLSFFILSMSVDFYLCLLMSLSLSFPLLLASFSPTFSLCLKFAKSCC